MYPIGIRVVKVAGIQIGATAVVCPLSSIKCLHHTDDMVVQADIPAKSKRGSYVPAGVPIGTNSRYWCPINPDADDATNVEDKKLEEVM